MIMGRVYKSRIAEKSRVKYGKPTYPGKTIKVKENGTTVYFRESASAIWEKILMVLKEEIPLVSFETWIEPCKPIELRGKKLKLTVDHQIQKDMIEKKYLRLLEIASKSIQYPISFEVLVEKKSCFNTI